MPRIAVVLALFCLSAAVPAGAAQPRWLGGKPFKLTADHNAKKPNVAVDAAGTGHFAWDVNQSGDDPLVYCRVPRGARACQHQTTIPLPLESFGEPQVLMVGSAVVLIAHRCCGPGEGTYAVVSPDGGTTFAAPRIIGGIEPGQAVAWPGTDVVALADDVVTAGVSFQAASLSGVPATTSAHVGDGVSQDYDGTIGFAGQTTPLVAFDDLHHGFWRMWSGAGDVNDVASWGPTQSLGALTELRMATGPAGVVLMAKRHFSHPFSDQYVARRYDPATGSFKPAVALSSTGVEDDVIFRDVFEDPGGHVEAVWIANGTHGGRTDPIRLRVSGHGGTTWRAERTLVRATHDTGFNLQAGAAADGGGFVAYDSNDSGPLWAVPIPKLSAQH
jgi:hypothetical protein